MYRFYKLKTVKHIINGIVWTVLGLYVLLVVLLHTPAIQSFLASQVSTALEKKLGTKVLIGNVDLGLFNRAIIDDIVLYDQTNKQMVKASRMSVKINLYQLTRGKIVISSAQLFGFQGDFYKQTCDSKPNFQFALDSLASKDTTSHTPLDLQISSLVIRHGKLKYDQHDILPTRNQFNSAHLDLQDISAHIMIPHITDDNVHAIVKKLSFKEKSGFDLKNLTLHFDADKNRAILKDFSCILPNSQLHSDSISAEYQFKGSQLDMSTLSFKGTIEKSFVTPSDLKSFFTAAQPFINPVSISTSFYGNNQNLNINSLYIHSEKDGLNVLLRADVQHLDNQPLWLAHVDDLRISGNSIDMIAKNATNNHFKMPDVVTRLGDINFKGDIGGRGNDLSLEGKLMTDAGDSDFDGTFDGQHFLLQLDTKGINLQRLLDNNQLGTIASNLTLDGHLHEKSLSSLTAKGTISRFDYNSYTYHDISIDGTYANQIIDGTLSMDDPNGKITIQGNATVDKNNPTGAFTASLRNFNPQGFRITDKFNDSVINADIDADISGNSLANICGTVNISDLSITGHDGEYRLNSLFLKADNHQNGNELSIDSDFGHFDIQGKFNYSTLAQSITNFIASKLPTLPGLPQMTHSGQNDFTLRADITKSDWLNTFFNLPVTITKPIHIDGSMNDETHQLDLNATLPRFSVNDGFYEDGIINVRTSSVNEVIISGHLRKIMDNGQKLDLNVNANGGNNQLITSINWNNNARRPFKGTFNCSSEFFKNEEGKSVAHARIHPSEIQVNDSIWHVQPSDIIYSEKNLVVDYFAIEHNDQHIIVSGLANKNPNDSLVVDLKDVDVNYILNLVNFHSVSFGGRASGKAYVKSAFSNPDAYANLIVKDFLFQEGRMGTLYAKAEYNKSDEQIDIHAQAIDGKEGKTLVNGYVSPARNYIDLKIDADNTRMEFLESFCESFMDNVEARANGSLRLAGDLSEINLTGMAVANGGLDITSLNTHYTLVNDTIRLIPDNIIFEGDTILDRNGNYGIVKGTLHHEHLTKLSYDLNIYARNLLSYDFPSYGDNTFFGTVYATGTCNIQGKSGSINFDINATPEKGSFIEYNAASPDAITDQQFITWRDKSQEYADSNMVVSNVPKPDMQPAEIDIPSDMHINFLINANPDFTLRLLMDKSSGDYIALNGSGTIRASYYNKGAFDMFGTYLVDHGIYKLTIQNIIKKDFQFQQGGTIVFGGNPYQSALNLNAVYTVNGVPLSDLQIGRSFSTNNIRVNCLMNINGTAESPRVEFDLDLPTVNTDAKQMVRSIINSEEEMNQQVIYLLSIGRFYTQNANNASQNQSQTSLAMQSLLSGTISQQINNVLSSFVNTSNWNFGANISTGDEGWNNAEYEGLLSGRLLNNRLLINGQFGYRDNANATTSFIGDFDIRYLLFPSGNLAIKVYNQTNDRYFTKNSLNTQGIGLIMKKDFNSWKDFFRRTPKTSK